VHSRATVSTECHRSSTLSSSLKPFLTFPCVATSRHWSAGARRCPVSLWGLKYGCAALVCEQDIDKLHDSANDRRNTQSKRQQSRR